MSIQELDDYLKHVRLWLRQAVQPPASVNDIGSNKGSEALHWRAAEPFRSLLLDPIGPDPNQCIPGFQRLPKPPRPSKALRARLNVKAVGVHSAGDSLPQGRQWTVYVAKEMFKKSAHFSGESRGATVNAELFLDLFHHAYRSLFGRQDTLIHSLLHGPHEKAGAVVEIASDKPQVIADTVTEVKKSQRFRLYSISLGKTWHRLADDDVLRQFSKTIWQGADHIAKNLRKGKNTATSDRQIVDDYTRLYGNQIVARMRTHPILTDNDGERCSLTVHEKLEGDALYVAELWRELNRDEHVHHKLTKIVSPAMPALRKSERVVRLVRMFQLFFLYRGICGPWFYVIVPRLEDQKSLQMCFTIGTEKRLLPEEQESLYTFSEEVRQEIGKHLLSLSEGHPAQIDQERRDLEEMVGAGIWPSLKARLPAPGKRLQDDSTGGIPAYMSFCSRVAELAVHEGKRIHFDVLVSGGKTASELLERISDMPEPSPGSWRVMISNEKNDLSKPNEPLISRILGNYAFLQERGVVLFGSRDGELLYLAKLLGPSYSPECITKGAECYLLQVREDGGVYLFFGGRLLLWRRAGAYVVPQHYGDEYRMSLVSWLKLQFPDTEESVVDFGVLADVVWSLSADRLGGGSFAIGRTNGFFNLSDHTDPLSEVFPYAEGLPLVSRGGEDVLKHLAVQDGAVLVDLSSGRVYGRRQLVPGRVNWEHYKKQWAADAHWEEWHKIFRWGTRHRSALALSIVAHEAAQERRVKAGSQGKPKYRGRPAAVVITVSSDGDIHVFAGAAPRPDLTYP